MYFINAITSISNQDSFGNQGFSKSVVPLTGEENLQLADFKAYIEPALIRRMSKILRMSVAAGEYCRRKNDSQEIEAIIVGTGLGCLVDTQKFLERFIEIEGLLPPTSFIQSTHNTIAGQVSLSMKNNGYNTTYTQNTISFELALQDAMMCLNDGMESVLVGGADEDIPFLDEVKTKLGLNHLNLTSGVTFLTLSKQKNENSIAEIEALDIQYQPTNVLSSIDTFIKKQGVPKDDLSHVFYSTPFHEGEKPSLVKGVNEATSISSLAGFYPTNSAFGLHLAADKLNESKSGKMLVCNNLSASHLGLMLLKSVS